MSRLKEIENMYEYVKRASDEEDGNNVQQTLFKLFSEHHIDWLIGRVKGLEYAAKYNGELNEFLQKRKLHPRTLSRHVVDAVMDYVEELEESKELALNDLVEERKLTDRLSKMIGDYNSENTYYKQALEETYYFIEKQMNNPVVSKEDLAAEINGIVAKSLKRESE